MPNTDVQVFRSGTHRSDTGNNGHRNGTVDKWKTDNINVRFIEGSMYYAVRLSLSEAETLVAELLSALDQRLDLSAWKTPAKISN